MARSPELIRAVRELAAENVSAQRIAVRLSRSVMSVRAIARENDIVLITKGQLRESFGLSASYTSFHKVR